MNYPLFLCSVVIVLTFFSVYELKQLGLEGIYMYMSKIFRVKRLLSSLQWMESLTVV
jgi:hypothetical protein